MNEHDNSVLLWDESDLRGVMRSQAVVRRDQRSLTIDNVMCGAVVSRRFHVTMSLWTSTIITYHISEIWSHVDVPSDTIQQFCLGRSWCHIKALCAKLMRKSDMDNALIRNECEFGWDLIVHLFIRSCVSMCVIRSNRNVVTHSHLHIHDETKS